jgi:hypothetical protein
MRQRRRLLEKAVLFSPDCAPIMFQVSLPSMPTLFSRSTRNQRGNCGPIRLTVRLYCTSQLAVFICCLFTRTSIRLFDVVDQGIMPSVITLLVRSARNQCYNCFPILDTVHFYCVLQLVVFVFCPFTRSSTR